MTPKIVYNNKWSNDCNPLAILATLNRNSWNRSTEQGTLWMVPSERVNSNHIIGLNTRVNDVFEILTSIRYLISTKVVVVVVIKR